MRRWNGLAQWALLIVLVLDVAFGALLLWGAPSSAMARATPPGADGTAEAAEPPEAEAVPTAEAIRLLGSQLAERAAELDRREAELAELARGADVLRAAGIAVDTGEETAGAAAEDTGPSEAFRTLQRAYENMEPETAARTLAALADRDSRAVVQLLLGWNPRTSGAVLDAMATTNPSLAADLSYKIWKLEPGGKD